MKAAVIQLNGKADLKENLKSISHYIAEAADNGAEIIVLPENFALMPINEHERSAIIEELGSGPIQEELAQLSRKYGIWLIGGSTLTIAVKEQNKPYATQIVYSPDGVMVGVYNKIHLFDVTTPNGEIYRESDDFAAGNAVKFVDIEKWRIGLSICYDMRFPELYRQLSDQGCTVITAPSAFTQQTGEAHWHVLLRARAIENQCYVLAAGQWGTHANGRKTYGHSLIIDPWGRVLAEVEEGEGFAIADLNFDEMQKLRANMRVLEHRRLHNVEY